ncbi:hypothetical protein BFP97_14525 [Roseivirga sp. 4D4]|uniref:ATP-binding protein n=1 Tax=Roseivirga sp. 4D4 TaxID=1889784 RepID=UPI000853D0E1|nr:ATP-binding protein [Roseivirga sp. 4D4]OEK02662.1 hypothetical protein BFP97_14525 [Roseivirga sp. 4D4]
MYDHISNIDRIKLQLIAPISQVVIFHTNGEVIDTCNTLFSVETKRSVFDQFDFLKSIEEVFPGLPLGERLTFEAIEWNEGTEGLFAMEFVKTDNIRIQWIIQDRSKDKAQIAQVQQERNESAINEEFLEIQRKYLEMEKELLNYKNDELQRIQKFKEQFFAEVSHEMRTPLNSISGLIDLLKSTKGLRDHEYLTALKATSNHLNAIINDVLDLSKIEAGKFRLTSDAFDLRQMLGRILKGFEVGASEKGVVLDTHLDTAIPIMIEGDEVRLSQVIYNLLGNALKFTERGSVSLSINVNSSELGHKLGFTITDTGKGMSEADVKQILEPYAQADGQDHVKYGGTGLGLGIAQQLIGLMGGALKIESQKGVGTSMSFELEFQMSERDVVSEVNSVLPDLGHLKVLFVEDDEIGLVLLKGIVSEAEIQATFSETVEAFNNEIQKQTYDFIVSDVNLPDGNMISAIKGLRATKGPNQFTKVIFLSGDDVPTKELNEIYGSHYLKKPIATNSLMDILMAEETEVAINLDNLEASTSGDKALMKEILNTILETLPVELSNLKKAESENNQEQLRKVLHKINPSISYLGNEQLIANRKSLYDKVLEQETENGIISEFCDLTRKALAAVVKEKERL